MELHRPQLLFHGVQSSDCALVNGTVLVLNGEGLTPRLLQAVVGNLDAQVDGHSLICADGGANALYEVLGSEKRRQAVLPRWIGGDLDSIRRDVRDFYECQGVQVEKIDSQDSTDFEKALGRCQDGLLEGSDTQPIIVVGWEGGRMDHLLAVFHGLYRYSNLPRPIYLVGENAVVFCLTRPIEHISMNFGSIGPTCGLVALGNPCFGVETTGLRWNLDGKRTLQLGGLSSSSNEAVASVVEVRNPSGNQLLWTCQVDLDR